jgi:hypothetical protein
LSVGLLPQCRQETGCAHELIRTEREDGAREHAGQYRYNASADL